MGLILGVDAGNSKTLAFVSTADGCIQGVGRSGCGDIHSVKDAKTALHEVKMAIDEAMVMAHAPLQDIDAGAFSMAGADWPEDYNLIRSFIDVQGFARNYVVVHDSIGGLRAGTPNGHGVSVILGTGVAIGAHWRERTWHSSFWTRALDTAGLEDDIYNAILGAQLNHSPATSLTDVFLSMQKKESVEEFIHALTRRENPEFIPRSTMMKVLLDEAANGDAVALHIVQRYAKRCANYALTAASHVNIRREDEFLLVFSGGLLRHPSKLFKVLISEMIQVHYPNAVPIMSDYQPVIGALLLGFDIQKIQLTEPIRQRLMETSPDSSIFST